MPRLFYIEFGGHAASSPGAPAPAIMGGMRRAPGSNTVSEGAINPARMPRQGDSGANEFNTIRNTVAALKGKTFLVWRPEDLAKALQEIATAPKKR